MGVTLVEGLARVPESVVLMPTLSRISMPVPADRPRETSCAAA